MLKQIDHVNLVVEDLEAMLAFYTGPLCMKVTRRVTISGEWVEEVSGLKGVEADVVYLELPEGGPRVELIRYHSPGGVRPDGLGLPHTRGLRHLAFRVEDISATVRHLERGGVKLMSQIQLVPDGQVKYAGGVRKRLVYFHDPEGNLLELCAYE